MSVHTSKLTPIFQLYKIIISLRTVSLQPQSTPAQLEVINGGYGIKNPLLLPEYNVPKDKGKPLSLQFMVKCDHYFVQI